MVAYLKKKKKNFNEPGMVAYINNPSTWEAHAGGS
jgi:hypothetical protein